MSSRCSEHGTPIIIDGHRECDCENGWGGDGCRTPPPTSYPCEPSDKAFRDAHNEGDKECGVDGVYGTCQPDKTCSCLKTGKTGSRCTIECLVDDDCGGGAIPNVRQGKGTCNTGDTGDQEKVCKCMNGWSGLQCRTPPADTTCKYDGDCGFGADVNGQCLGGKCTCINKSSDPDNPFIYTGPFCEKPLPRSGETCESDKDCVGGLKCMPDKTCFSNTVSPSQWKEGWDSFVRSTLSETTLDFYAVDKGGSWLARKTMTAFLREKFAAQLADKMGQEGLEVASKEAVEQLIKILPEQAAGKLMAELAAREAAVVTLDELAVIGAEVAVASAFPPLGWVVALIDLLQIFGLILDLIDSRGLNEQMMQSVLDQYKRQYEIAVNTSDDAIKYGLEWPRPFAPLETVEFKTEYASKAVQDKLAKDAAEYLSLLTVNSAGEEIRPYFASLAQQEMVEKKGKYKVYWSMSGGNVDVFNRLISYGWVMWLLGGLLLVSVVLICVFTSPAVQAKLKK